MRLLVAAVLLLRADSLLAASGVWVGFRYDATRVLIYTEESQDTSGITRAEAAKKRIADPVARWGCGGYLLPIPAGHEQATAIGEAVTLALGGTRTIPVTVDSYVEQWGMSNPAVRTGALLRVKPAQLARFHATKADYFLVYSGGTPSAEIDPNPGARVGTETILNRFGPDGELRLVSAEAGWRVTFWRKEKGKLLRTLVGYSYGD